MQKDDKSSGNYCAKLRLVITSKRPWGEQFGRICDKRMALADDNVLSFELLSAFQGGMSIPMGVVGHEKAPWEIPQKAFVELHGAPVCKADH